MIPLLTLLLALVAGTLHSAPPTLTVEVQAQPTLESTDAQVPKPQLHISLEGGAVWSLGPVMSEPSPRPLKIRTPVLKLSELIVEVGDCSAEEPCEYGGLTVAATPRQLWLGGWYGIYSNERSNGAWLARLDAQGGQPWQTRLNGPKGQRWFENRVDGIGHSPDGVVVLGRSRTDTGTAVGWVNTVTASGTVGIPTELVNPPRGLRAPLLCGGSPAVVRLNDAGTLEMATVDGEFSAVALPSGTALDRFVAIGPTMALGYHGRTAQVKVTCR